MRVAPCDVRLLAFFDLALATTQGWSMNAHFGSVMHIILVRPSYWVGSRGKSACVVAARIANAEESIWLSIES